VLGFTIDVKYLFPAKARRSYSTERVMSGPKLLSSRTMNLVLRGRWSISQIAIRKYDAPSRTSMARFMPRCAQNKMPSRILYGAKGTPRTSYRSRSLRLMQISWSKKCPQNKTLSRIYSMAQEAFTYWIEADAEWLTRRLISTNRSWSRKADAKIDQYKSEQMPKGWCKDWIVRIWADAARLMRRWSNYMILEQMQKG